MIKKYLILLFFSLSFSTLSFSENIDITGEGLMLLVHKTPTCGCCKMWMKHVEKNGFTAYGQDHQNLMKIKEKYNIQPQYRSCHTAVSPDGFIFEGHIPSKYIKQFLSEDHPEAIGLSVPGMPLGSPGMEVEDRFMPYDVLILFKDGTSKIYAEVRH
ncbi:MAG: metal-binding protein [Gammaproteobacteria bacterium]|nr:metal-binding protein [Gammaproteobacteria bacterium]